MCGVPSNQGEDATDLGQLKRSCAIRPNRIQSSLAENAFLESRRPAVSRD